MTSRWKVVFVAHAVGIVGASGYGGGELVRLLQGHPAMRLEVMAAGSKAAVPVRQRHPNLTTDDVFDGVDVDALAALDLVFLATPHAVSLRLAPALIDAGSRVVDLSGAFRLPAAAFATWYGQDHARPDLTVPDSRRLTRGRAVYGLTEWTRDAVRDADLVANPGCYPTAALLGLLPLADLVEPATVVVDAKSGTSGAGRGLADRLHHANVHGDLATYGAPGHRHTGEIEQWLWRLGGTSDARQSPWPVTFTPHLAPMARGLLATSYAHVGPAGDDGAVRDALEDRYRDETFVTVLEPGEFPGTKPLTGSNGCHISAVVDERTGRVTVTSAIDNLGKGAAGQALHNANVMLGLDEALGLTPTGVFP